MASTLSLTEGPVTEGPAIAAAAELPAPRAEKKVAPEPVRIRTGVRAGRMRHD
jgi:hypothetical protein